jgi:hypothetical protein
VKDDRRLSPVHPRLTRGHRQDAASGKLEVIGQGEAVEVSRSKSGKETYAHPWIFVLDETNKSRNRSLFILPNLP